MSKVVELSGKIFGNLTVMHRNGSLDGKATWVCKCVCGNLCSVTGDNLRRKHTQSCGCLQKQRVISKLTKHSMSRSKEYIAWLSVKSRTTNKFDKDYSVYSKLGMEDSWKSNFSEFLGEIGKVPDNKVQWSVGRIDNKLGYFKGNIRWESPKEQSRNKGMYDNNVSGETGVVWRTDELKDGTTSTRAVAFYNDLCGKRVSKSFRVSTHGLMESFALAVYWRRRMIAELNMVGAGYSGNHGK